MKGQVTFINLLILLMVMFLFLAFMPIIIKFINDYAKPSVEGYEADQPTKDLLMSLIQLFPIATAVMIIASALFYAIPRVDR
jgi:hypothetical protein